MESEDFYIDSNRTHSKREEQILRFLSLPAIRFALITVPTTGIGILFSIPVVWSLSTVVLLIVLSIVFFALRKMSALYVTLCLAVGVILSVSVLSFQPPIPLKVTPEVSGKFRGTIQRVTRRDLGQIGLVVEGELHINSSLHLKNNSLLLTVTGLEKTPRNFHVGNYIAGIIRVRLPRERQFPTDFSERQYAQSIGVQWVARARVDDVIPTYCENVATKIETLKLGIERRIDGLFTPPIAPIVKALTTGNQHAIPLEVREDFVKTGTVHILSISGTHIVLISAIVFALIGSIRSSIGRTVIYLSIVGLFILLSGVQPSALRAGVMVSIVFLARTNQRKLDSFNLFLGCVILLICIQPTLVFSAGFQMSVASVLGLIVFQQPFDIALQSLIVAQNKVVVALVGLLSVGLSAGIFVAPIVAYYFSLYSVISPLTNLFVVPLYGVGMIFSYCAISVSLLSTTVASLYSASAEFPFTLANAWNSLIVKAQYGWIEGANALAISVAVSLVLVYTLRVSRRRVNLFRVCVSLLSLVLVVLIAPRQPLIPSSPIARERTVTLLERKGIDTLEVYFFDREPSRRGQHDRGLVQYIAQFRLPCKVFLSGKDSRLLADSLATKVRIQTEFMPISLQEKISRRHGYNSPLFKHISYDL